MLQSMLCSKAAQQILAWAIQVACGPVACEGRVLRDGEVQAGFQGIENVGCKGGARE